MKKFLSVFLSLCLLLALGATLTSCQHECKFSDEWSSDDGSHWHECTNANCDEIDDKEDHKWDEGEITTKATQDTDGVRTFTCTVCKETKTEAFKFAGLSEEEWNAAFATDVFENFAYQEVATTTGSGVSVATETYYKFTKDLAWVKMTVAEQSQESYAPDLDSVNEARNALLNSLKELATYDSYKYDAETKTYKATKEINIASLNASTSDITLTFDDGKLVEAKYSISFTQNNIEFSATSTITISHYGTVVLARPLT